MTLIYANRPKPAYPGMANKKITFAVYFRMKAQIKLLFILFAGMMITSCKTDKALRQLRHGKTPKGYVALDTVTVTAKKGIPLYQPSATLKHDLIHTKLEVSFDIPNQLLFGKAYITLKPHFYASDLLVLNGRQMDIQEISLIGPSGNRPLSFTYADSFHLNIKLDRVYNRNESFTVFINYTANPSRIRNEGGSAITDNRGLYFIDPLEEDSTKPTEIWTQGEVQANSCWFPTIDEPDQRMTQELYITVPDKYKTLSNGLLISSTPSGNGLRTDYWKQDKTHAPYLVMMAIGDFTIVKDSWRGKEVSYYLDPPYGEYARDIFGNTPEMLEYYSSLLGVPFAWDKYSQVVVHDYVSGAMENTSATLHFEGLNQTRRELIDRDYESIIAHELFHQWFGDLVTCESWANLPLNESFADYGEYLWDEHKHGKEIADYTNLQAQRKYFQETENKQVNLVRFNYDEPDDMFDRHSYEKGGCVLHMLRNYLGDEAFFAGLKKYLSDNAFTPAEVHQLRIAMEKVSGEDLNWFFNQWFYNSGHPVLDFKYSYLADTLYVDVIQTRSKEGGILFRLPMKLDIYSSSGVETKDIVIDKAKQSFKFQVKEKPLLVNEDATKTTLAKITTNKTVPEYIYQYQHGKLFRDRYDAIDYLIKNQKDNESIAQVLQDALSDKNFVIRELVAAKISYSYKSSAFLQDKLRELALTDPKSTVRSTAIEKLDKVKDKSNIEVFNKALKDSSYEVLGSTIDAIASLDSVRGLELARQMHNETNAEMAANIANVLATYGGPEDQGYFEEMMNKGTGYLRYQMLYYYANYLIRQGKPEFDKAIITYENYGNSNKSPYAAISVSSALKRLKSAYERRKKATLDNTKSIPAGDLKALSEAEEKVKFFDYAVREIEELIGNLPKHEGGH